MTLVADPSPHILCVDLVRIFSTDGVEVQALQGLNLRVDAGEMVAVVGASGSGKSTLLTILSGLDTATAGVARVVGHDLFAMRERERVAYRRHTVGFVWQQTARNLLPYLTAAENVALAIDVAGTARGRERSTRIDELLDLVGVGDLADRRPGELSGGQQQRVAIAVALANRPEVLLADEPTGELDEATSAEVLEAMRGVNEALGVTTLIVTHDPTVSEHVRRTVQIRDGRTSTEVLRSTRVGASGAEEQVAEEFAVLDRVGRLQLPHDFVEALSLRDRVRLALETDHVGVWPGSDPSPSAGAARGGADRGAAHGAARDSDTAAPDGPRAFTAHDSGTDATTASVPESPAPHPLPARGDAPEPAAPDRPSNTDATSASVPESPTPHPLPARGDASELAAPDGPSEEIDR